VALGTPLRQRRHDRFWKRVRYHFSRAWGTRLQKSQKLYFVSAGDYRAKRLVFRDSLLAAEIEDNLFRFRSYSRFPRPVFRFEHELWLEYVVGEKPSPDDLHFLEEFGAFYGALYAFSPKRVAPDDSIFPARLSCDLDFLAGVGVITLQESKTLRDAARALLPESLWIGFDYTDPVLKNFVLAAEDGRLYAVDVESLEREQLLGTGIAKALVRWLDDPERGGILDKAGASLPGLREAFPYVRLCFETHYAVRMFLEQKWKRLQTLELPRLAKLAR
jgi:hypothetical protein